MVGITPRWVKQARIFWKRIEDKLLTSINVATIGCIYGESEDEQDINLPLKRYWNSIVLTKIPVLITLYL